VSRPLVLLIDGQNIAHRAYHATNPGGATDASGLPLLEAMVQRAVGDWRPSAAVVALDAGPSFRGVLYPAYKAARKPRPAGLVADLRRLGELDRIAGLPVARAFAYEADDVVATLLERHPECDAVVYSSDSDLLQLVVEGRVAVATPDRRHFRTEADVVAKFGVPPARVPEFKALAGDASDNIGGVPGVGPEARAGAAPREPDLDRRPRGAARLARARGRRRGGRGALSHDPGRRRAGRARPTERR
jgi:DNA polymerase-1